jgi:hypothetical protein
MKPAELVDWDPNPLTPRNIWANACVHSVASAYGIRNRQEWSAHPHYRQLAKKLADLYGRGIPLQDIAKLIRGEIPWPL